MDTLIANVTAVTVNEQMDVLFGAYLGITDGKISYISKKPPEEQPATIIDGTGMVAMPGLVNCHTHLATTVLRSMQDDATRAQALEQQLLVEDRLDRRAAKASALLGIAECLRFGITSVSDLYYYPDAVAEAAAEAGIKANVAMSAYRFIDHSEDFDFETDEQCQELCRVVEKWHGYEQGRIRIDAGFYAQYTSNHKLWEALASYGAEKGLGIQLHLSETEAEAEECMDRTGLAPAELLDCHRVFSLPATCAGCGGLTQEEKNLLGKRKATAVTTPIANAKAGLPAMDVTGCVKAGMNVALGTGGAVECGNLDLFEVMRHTAMAARTAGGDANAMPAAAMLMMATTCGARAQGRGEQTGMLKVGMDADVVLVDFSAPHLMPCHNVMNALVFSAKGGDVAMTMVGGKILYQNGRFPTIDLNAVVEELMTYAIPRLNKEG
ncbi:MAG: amidohydrolase family protein [Oscillospiraceae bacterium]|nr:amidohydrolase family protein [Oscillospiraceae bacterium]